MFYLLATIENLSEWKLKWDYFDIIAVLFLI